MEPHDTKLIPELVARKCLIIEFFSDTAFEIQNLNETISTEILKYPEFNPRQM